MNSDFLEAWRRGGLPATLLVEISLVDPSARSVRLSYADVTTDAAAGVHFFGALEDAGTIDDSSAFLPSGMEQASWSFSLLDVPLPGQASGETAADLLAQYRWVGAGVVASLKLEGFATPEPVFCGRIESVRPTLGSIFVECLQRNDWNRKIVPAFVDRQKWPRASEKAVGAPIPVVVGKGSARPLRGVFARAMGNSRNNFDHNGGAIPALQGVLVDTGRGGGAANPKARVLFSSGQLSNLGSGVNGSNFFGKNSSEVPAVVNPAGADIFTAADGSGFTIPDEAGTFWLPIFCSEVKSIANSADNPRAILDPTDETSYAKIDQAAGAYYLQGLLPDVDPPGQMLAVYLMLGYTSFASVGDIVAKFVSGAGSTIFTPAANTTAIEVSGAVSSLFYSTDWLFSRNTLTVGFQVPGAGANVGVKFFARTLGIVVQYRPEQKSGGLVKGWRYRPTIFGYEDYTDGSGSPEPSKGVVPYMRERVEIPTTYLDGEFYANGDGPIDDGGGTFTGTPSALISRAPDIASYVLQTFGGQSPADVETGVGVHGSFADARAKLKTWNARDMEHLLAVDTTSLVSNALESLARESCSAVWLSRFSNKFKWAPFVSSPPVSYPRKLEPEDMLDPEFLKIETMPSSRLISSLRLPYLWDAFKKEFSSEVAVTPEFSSSGYDWQALRDELMTVSTGSNDWIDWRAGSPGTAYSAQLDAGDWDPWGFAQHAAAKMNAAGPEDCIVHFGPYVAAGYNDRLMIYDGAYFLLTISAGEYASMEALAAEIQAQANAVSSSWVATYSRTSKKFTIYRSAGTGKIIGPGPDAPYSLNGALGLSSLVDTTANNAVRAVSEHEVEESRFVVAQPSAKLTLEIETGTHGLNGTGTGAWALLGFSGTRDTLPGTNTTSAVGDCPKGNREQVMRYVQDTYGATRELALQCRTIRDTDTAREVRNRYADLGAGPRPIVSFSSAKVPDLENFQVVEFSDRFDRLVRYSEFGSDRTWAGKRFWVVSTRQHVRPKKWATEVVCVRA